MAVMVDACGLSCPQPVVMTKSALEKAPGGCEVLVDNPAARENVTRYAENAGFKVQSKEENGNFRLVISK